MGEIYIPKKQILRAGHEQKKKIFITGSAGVGKSATADTLSEITGIPHLHTDLIVVNPDYSYVPEEIFVAKVQEFLNKNPSWIIEGHSLGRNPDLFSLIYSLSDMVLDFKFSQDESIQGFTKRMIEIKKGNAPHSIHVTTDYASADTYRLGIQLNNSLVQKFTDLRKGLLVGDKVNTFTNHDQLNQFIDEFKETQQVLAC